MMGLCPKQTKLLFELKYLNQNNMKQKKLFNIISISLSSYSMDAVTLSPHFKILLEHGFLKMEERSY